MDKIYCYFYDRTEDTIELAEAETVFLTSGTIVSHGVVICQEPINWTNSAFIKGGGELIASGGDLSQLCEHLQKTAFSAHNFKIISEPIPAMQKGDHHAIIKVADAIKGPVKLKDPEVSFILILKEKGCWLLKSDYSSYKKSWKEFRHKPFQFCNALPIELARAVINLSASPTESIFDPCCGSGTIPMMAAELGHKALAGDKSWPNLKISQNNFIHYGLGAEFKQEDATETRRTADCIITNLPYGKYLPLSNEVLDKILENFRTLTQKVTLITTEDIKEIILTKGYQINKVITCKKNQLRRYIYLLKS